MSGGVGRVASRLLFSLLFSLLCSGLPPAVCRLASYLGIDRVGVRLVDILTTHRAGHQKPKRRSRQGTRLIFFVFFVGFPSLVPSLFNTRFVFFFFHRFLGFSVSRFLVTTACLAPLPHDVHSFGSPTQLTPFTRYIPSRSSLTRHSSRHICPRDSYSHKNIPPPLHAHCILSASHPHHWDIVGKRTQKRLLQKLLDADDHPCRRRLRGMRHNTQSTV